MEDADIIARDGFLSISRENPMTEDISTATFYPGK
jgi:hypothetical protein